MNCLLGGRACEVNLKVGRLPAACVPAFPHPLFPLNTLFPPLPLLLNPSESRYPPAIQTARPQHQPHGMSAAGSPKATGPFAPQYITGVYLPSAALIVGAALVKKELLPLAVAIAASLAGWAIYNNSNSNSASRPCLPFQHFPPVTV